MRRLSKALSSLTNVGTHHVGAIVHSGQAPHGKEIYGSFDYYQWAHDSNLTMTVLLDTVMKLFENYKVPPILYVQMDNCWRENKNQFMLALLGLMVKKKEFEKVGNIKNVHLKKLIFLVAYITMLRLWDNSSSYDL